MIRKRNLYDPASSEPFSVSRSKIDLFVQCPRCFWLDARAGVKRPSMPAFSLNNAVDALLKKEFDTHRAAGTPHPLMTEAGIDAVPFGDDRMEEWRDALRRGISFLHEPSGLFVRGGVDDVWAEPSGRLIIVDYKATASVSEVSLDGPYKEGYKRQMEIYQWLFRKNDFQVNPVGYFLYCNGNLAAPAFNGRLDFRMTLLPHEGSDAWIEPELMAMKTCLEQDLPPAADEDCEHCAYRSAALAAEPS